MGASVASARKAAVHTPAMRVRAPASKLTMLRAKPPVTGMPPLAPAAALAKTPITTVRPTGVGLPMIGVQTGLQAGDTAAVVKALRRYHNSGRYEHDLWTVARMARATLIREDDQLPEQDDIDDHAS